MKLRIDPCLLSRASDSVIRSVKCFLFHPYLFLFFFYLLFFYLLFLFIHLFIYFHDLRHAHSFRSSDLRIRLKLLFLLFIYFFFLSHLKGSKRENDEEILSNLTASKRQQVLGYIPFYLHSGSQTLPRDL